MNFMTIYERGFFKVLTVTLTCLLVVSFSFASGDTILDHKQLYNDIFANHNGEYLPRENMSTPVEVMVTFYFMTLTSFDEVEETIVILGGLRVDWKDAGISWDPTTYNGIPYYFVPKSKIWTPPLTLINSVDVLEPLGDGKTFNVIVMYDGNITLPVGGLLKSKCSTNIFKFPYDSQTCMLQFLVWTFVETDVVFKLAQQPVSLAFLSTNSNWDLQSIDTKVLSYNSYSTLEVYVTIKRQPLYYSIIVICPTIMFSLLNPLVFLLPVESGERIGLSMTILLSYAIFLTLVSAAIPASSNPMSLLLIDMMVTMVVSGIIVVMAIISTWLYFREKEDISPFWKCFGSRLACKKKNKISNLTPVTKLSQEKDKSQLQETSNEDVHVSWKDVSSGMDSFCLITSYILGIVIGAVFFGVVFID